jgi:hypothetical protein
MPFLIQRQKTIRLLWLYQELSKKICINCVDDHFLISFLCVFLINVFLDILQEFFCYNVQNCISGVGAGSASPLSVKTFFRISLPLRARGMV